MGCVCGKKKNIRRADIYKEVFIKQSLQQFNNYFTL